MARLVQPKIDSVEIISGGGEVRGKWQITAAEELFVLNLFFLDEFVLKNEG